MKKLALLIVCMLCFASASLAAPAAPQMSYSLNGTNITVDWSNVADATGYTLYYAAYPYAPGDYIGSLDRGNNTSYSIKLWDSAAYYIATSARNAEGSSGYSNIEYFIMKDHELTWEDKATLGSARTQFAGGVIDDMIYSFGGYDESGLLLNSMEIYDPTADSWVFGTANTKSVADLSGAVVNKKLYVFGATGDDCGTTPFAEKYDPNTAQWSTIASKTTQTSGAPAVTYNGKIYLFGGWQINSCNDADKTLKKNVEAYDPLTNRWQTVTTMPKALEGATVAVYGDKAYVIGGVDDQGTYAIDIIAYDFKTNKWIESGLGSLSTPRMFPANSSAPVIEDTIVLVGGWIENAARSTNANRVESNVVEIYSPRARSVAIGEPLPEATAGHLPAVIGGELFVIGGMANGRATDKSLKADITIENEIRGVDLHIDGDGDGFTLAEDCNDNDQNISPGTNEVPNNSLDDNCNGQIDELTLAVFNDPNLRACIESETFSGLSLDEITYLNCTEENISSLEGIQNLTNLETLWVGNNPITDFGFLQGLDFLSTFECQDCGIVDPSMLSQLTNLTRLYVNSNNISDFTFLANLTSLTTLWIGNNQITDMNFLKDHLQNQTSLSVLHIENSPIGDISFLQNLTNLTSLYLGGSEITNITPLQNMTRMETLDLNNNQINDITPLQGMADLTQLNLAWNCITDFSTVIHVENLQIDNQNACY